MTHRWRANASLNIGLSATVSARALKLAGNCFSGFFHYQGMSAQRMETSSRAPSAVDAVDRMYEAAGLNLKTASEAEKASLRLRLIDEARKGGMRFPA
jgi:hypothetical protein